ncbi:ATP-binding protein [Proteocatella sphenisci]|uniref:ATP-binding protein n=1 Tax=Proteocatella sphenisci TaxID=181070 RepID=UPI0004916343|nr:ATP-binding protein [Proteocatella sphenisci]
MINHSQKNIIKMTLPTEPKLISVIRMTASSIANHIGFNIEEIEDVKIAVSEACSNVIKYSDVETFDLYFSSGEDFIEVQVEDKGKGCNSEEIKDPIFDENRSCGGLGIYIIKTLMDDVKVISEEENGTIIYMKKIIGRDE